MFSILLAAVLFAPTNVAKQQGRYDTSRQQLEQLAKAHGFVIGQQYSLELISRQFPELSSDVNEAWRVFESSALGEGNRGTEMTLSELLGDQWPGFDANMRQQVKASFDQRIFDRDDAITFVAQVKARARGELPESIRAALLSANPRYSKNPAQEFLDGWKKSYTSTGHPMAKGASFNITYPTSWAATEGELPDTLQNFRSEGGYGLEMVTIVTKSLPVTTDGVITQQDRLDIFSPPNMRDFLPGNATLIGGQTAKIDGNPAGVIEYTMILERGSVSSPVHAWTINFLSDNTLVSLQFFVFAVHKSESELAGRMDSFKPLFLLMANSVVFADKRALETPLQAPSRSGSYPIATLQGLGNPKTFAIAVVLTWAIGLAPPLIVRYVNLGPLDRRTASWVAACLCIAFWIVDEGVAQADGCYAGGHRAVFIIMFAVSRWIMSHGHVSSTSRREQVAHEINA